MSTEKITIGAKFEEPVGLFPRVDDSSETDSTEETIEGDESEEMVEDENSPDEEMDTSDDELDDDQSDEDIDGKYAELQETNRRLMQSQADKDIRQKGFETKINQELQELKQLILKTGADDTNVLSSADPEDFGKIADIQALNRKVDLYLEEAKKGKTEPESQSYDQQADAQWCDSQPDIKQINDFINKNRPRLSNDPGVQAAGGSQISQYFAVKAFMQDEQLRNINKEKKDRKKYIEKQKSRGKSPKTEGISKMSGVKKKGKGDYLDKFYNKKHNKVYEY